MKSLKKLLCSFIAMSILIGSLGGAMVFAVDFAGINLNFNNATNYNADGFTRTWEGGEFVLSAENSVDGTNYAQISGGPLVYYYTTELALTGTIVAEGKFRFDTTSITVDNELNTSWVDTFSIATDGGENFNINNAYGGVRTVYAKKNNLYVCMDNRGVSGNTWERHNDTVVWENIDPTKWYDVKVVFYVDGDNTTLDTFDYSISDGEETKTGSGIPLGASAHYSKRDQYNMTKIKSFSVANARQSGLTVSVDNVSITEKIIEDDLVATVSVADGASISADEDVLVNFNVAISDASAALVKLYEKSGEEYVEVGSDVTATFANDKKSILFENLSAGKSYKVVVPDTVVSANSNPITAALTVEFTTIADETPIEYLIEADFEEAATGGVGSYISKYGLSRVYSANTGSTSDMGTGILTNASNGDPTILYYSTALNLTGDIVAEGKFRFNDSTLANDTNNAVINTFGIVTDGGSNGETTSPGSQYDRVRTIYAKNNNLYVGNIKPDAAIPPNRSTITQTGTIIWENIDPAKWYDIEITFHIDGDKTTYDTFDYVVTDGTTTVKDTGIYLGSNLIYSKPDQWDMSLLKGISFGDATGSTASVSLDDLKVYQKTQEADFTASVNVADGEMGVTAEEIIVTLTEAVSSNEGAKIKLYEKSDEEYTQSSISGTLSSDGKTVTFSGISTNKEYKLVVPSDILSINGKTIKEGKTICFATAEATEYILKEDIGDQALSYYNNGTYKKSSWDSSSSFTLEGDNDKYLRITKGDSGNPNIFLYNAPGGDMNLKGNVVAEGNYKFIAAPEISGNSTTPVNTIGIITDGATGDATAPSINGAYGTIRTVYAKTVNNVTNLYVSEDKPTDTTKSKGTYADTIVMENIDTNKWYNIKITMNIDGDATTFDSFNYSITEEGTERTAKGGPIVLGGNTAQWAQNGNNNGYNMTHAKTITFGEARIAGSEFYVNDIKAYYAEELKVYSSVSNGATGVNPVSDINITFSMPVSDSDYINDICIYEKSGSTYKPVTVIRSLSENLKVITLKGELSYQKEYKIVVPTTITSTDGNALKEAVEILFTTADMPVGIEISDVLVNGADTISSIEAGQSYVISATFKNVAIETGQNVSLIAAVFDGSGKMTNIAYVEQKLALNEQEILSCSLTLPQVFDNTSGNAKLKIYAWDSIKTMTPVSSVVEKP